MVFDSLKVIELAEGIAGPLVGLRLAEMGAEVIKIEPEGGDYLRGAYPLAVDSDTSAAFFDLNRGKRSVMLGGPERVASPLLLRLLQDADVVITDQADHQLVVHFYSVNGLKRVTVLEDRHQIRIETLRNSIWRFIDNLHATTIAERASGWAIRGWAWYVEFSIWCLLAMVLTGLWMGLRARFPYRLGQAVFIVGLGIAAALFELVR